MNQNEKKIKKNCRTFFPMGFGVGKVEGSIIVLDFMDIIDAENDVYEIIASIAMTKDKAKSLMSSLDDVVNKSDDDNNG